jgi:glycosyltransferase involved in cell wall biosynthesis
MLLSIVIPTYRRPEMLAELLDALAPQLFPEVELLVVDNDPAASARAVVARDPRLRYVHEPRPGVVNARNRGVAEAGAGHILFIDDDEVPVAGWLDAFAAQARDGVVASFGRIVPRYEAPVPPGLARLLDGLFSREAVGPTGTDITALWPYLGTGNALFRRDICFGAGAPFDARFNESGGEDIWLIRGLVARGVRLLWNREGLVEEVVPASRMTLDYLKRRKFAHGQQRVIMNYGTGGGRGLARALPWMAVGAVQALGFGTAARVLALAGSARRFEAEARMHAGLGKLRWRGALQRNYGS